MSELLSMAHAQLDSDDPHSNRRACWFARSALEARVDELLEVKGVETGSEASMRARLSCLEVVYHEAAPMVAARAQYAWARLSEACHQHAYQLSPTHSEASHLVRLVEALGEPVLRASVASGSA